MRRSTAFAATVVITAVVGLLAGTPAWAHEEISPYAVPTNRPAFLVLSVANEKRVDLNRVTIDAPANGRFGHAARDPQGWTSTLSHTSITWSGGAVRPDRFEQFGFDVEGFAQPGPVSYQVTLGYADGTSTQSEVTALAVADGAPPIVAPPATDEPAPTTTAAPGDGNGGPPGPGEPVADADEGRATVALVLSVMAMAMASGGLTLAMRKPKAAGDEGQRPDGQDW